MLGVLLKGFGVIQCRFRVIDMITKAMRALGRGAKATQQGRLGIISGYCALLGLIEKGLAPLP